MEGGAAKRARIDKGAGGGGAGGGLKPEQKELLTMLVEGHNKKKLSLSSGVSSTVIGNMAATALGWA